MHPASNHIIGWHRLVSQIHKSNVDEYMPSELYQQEYN